MHTEWIDLDAEIASQKLNSSDSTPDRHKIARGSTGYDVYRRQWMGASARSLR